MLTYLSQEHILSCRKALQGEGQLIGWGLRRHYHLHHWQEAFTHPFFVDTNLTFWDQTVEGQEVYNPSVLEKYSPDQFAVINYFLSPVVAEYTTRISGMNCIRPLPLQQMVREVELNNRPSSDHKASALSPKEVRDILKHVSPRIRKYSPTEQNVDISGLFPLLGSYDWVDCVTGIVQNVPIEDPKNNVVALVTNSLYPGGAERQIVNCATGFKALGWHPYFVAQMSGHITPHYMKVLQDNHIPYAFMLEGVSFEQNLHQLQSMLRTSPKETQLALWHMPQEFLTHLIYTIAYFKKIRPRLVVCYLDWGNVLGALAGLLCGVPEIIISGRNYSPDHFPHFFKKEEKSLFNVYQILAQCPTVRFTNNAPKAGDTYADWLGIAKDHIKFIPNSLTNSFMKLPPAKSIQTTKIVYGIKPKDKIVLGVFRLAPEKRPDKYISVLSNLIKADKNVRGIICGVGPLLPDLQKQARKLKIEDKLIFAGLCESVAELMNVSAILLHTAAYEGMPNVMLEAQSQALPIVCTKSGGVENCLAPVLLPYAFEQEAWDEVTRAAIDLLKKPALRQKLGLTAQKHVRKEHSIRKLVERNLALTAFADPKNKTQRTKR